MIHKIIIFSICFIVLLNSVRAVDQEEYMSSFDFREQTDDFWKKHLPTDVYNICRQSDTERAFTGKYDKFYEKGTYYCHCCGGDHPVFSSKSKYNSTTGWPSFWEPINPDNITFTKEQRFLGILTPRIEVSCSRCGAHLGHVFDDGPKDKTGKRYCINSLALIFVPKDQKPKNFIIDNK
ncbi:MAG: peptide-methionine (R)-S-oxide reductase MsrB [Rickettsiaceae bacterium]|nr:peptide-methionine (R)-S-oxide reductase MsrB [Rickettsiaceae bacterium]MDP5083336.1 peptide-methionine (R)-S-oxide reductase MsrB [Rickettsiaceae bacterium]